MANFRLMLFFAAVLACSPALTEDVSADISSDLVREPRSLHKRKLCRKYGICEGYGGYQGNYNNNYNGYQQGSHGYPGQPPVNIAISQSQTSANQGGGGFGSGYYPNNYQYNGGYGGYPNHGHGGYNGNQGYHGNQGYNGNQGYGGYSPDYYGNGQSSNNNQFNGNYYGPGGNYGYGFQRPYSGFYDENVNEDGQSHGEGDDTLERKG